MPSDEQNIEMSNDISGRESSLAGADISVSNPLINQSRKAPQTSEEKNIDDLKKELEMVSYYSIKKIFKIFVQIIIEKFE